MEITDSKRDGPIRPIPEARHCINNAQQRGIRVGGPRKLTDTQIVRAQLNLAEGRLTLADLAQEFGVAPRALSRALRAE